MKEALPYYCKTLRDQFERRRKRNRRYSLRGFARSLKVDAGLLSRVLTRKGSLSLNAGEKLCVALKLSKADTLAFLESIADDKKAMQLKRYFERRADRRH